MDHAGGRDCDFKYRHDSGDPEELLDSADIVR
jgi:hypothetical protein